MSRRNPTLGAMAAVLVTASTCSALAGTCLGPVMSSQGQQVMSPFGLDRSARAGASKGYHQGLDIVNSVGRGDPIRAGVSGKVAVAKNSQSAGKTVVVETADGTQRFVFMHLDAINPQISAGVAVETNTEVGKLGSTGVSSSGPHLHLGALLRGEALKASGGESRVWFSPGGWTGSKSSPPMTADQIKAAAPASWYFVNPETYLDHRIPFRKELLSAPQYAPYLNRPDGLTLAPTCEPDPTAVAESPPATSNEGGALEQSAGAEGYGTIDDVGFAVDMAGADRRGLLMQMARQASAGLNITTHQVTGYPGRSDAAAALLILQTLEGGE